MVEVAGGKRSVCGEGHPGHFVHQKASNLENSLLLLLQQDNVNLYMINDRIGYTHDRIG